MALKKFEGMQTEWGGLWYNEATRCYRSTGISFKLLRQFKGNVRLIVRKNRFYQKDSQRPNYVFTLRDAKTQDAIELQADEINRKLFYDYATGHYYDEDGNRLYTRTEVENAVSEMKSDLLYGMSPDDCMPWFYV